MAQNSPESVWTYNNNPQKSGWNTGKLKNLKQFIIDSTQVTGLMVIHNGQVVFEYGDVQEIVISHPVEKAYLLCYTVNQYLRVRSTLIAR